MKQVKARGNSQGTHSTQLQYSHADLSAISAKNTPMLYVQTHYIEK